MAENISKRAGVCPKCGSENLNYDGEMELGISEDEVYYSFVCNDCGFSGKEWHKLVFDGFTDDEGKEV